MRPIRLGIAAFTLLLRIPSLFEPRWYSDESVFTTVAWAMTKGLTLYSGVYDLQPPGIYWLYWLLIGPLGGSQQHVVVQIAICLFVVGTALLTFEIARRLVALWPAALAGLLVGFVWAIPTMDGDLLNVELAALPFFLASLLLAFSMRSPVVLASGILLGIALTFRPSFAVDGLALLVPLFSTGRREVRVLLVALGVASTLAVVVIGLWWEGSWAAYVNVVMPSDRRYLLKGNGDTLVPIFVRVLILGVFGFMFFVRAKSSLGRLLSVWLPASLVGSSVTPVGYTHFAHEAIPPMAIGIAVIASRYRVSWRSLSIAGLALVLCSEALLILPEQQTALMRGKPPPVPLKHNFGYQTLPAYYANWFALANGIQSDREYSEWFPGVTAREAELARLQAVGRSQDATLLVLGSPSWLNFESGLLPATPYLNTWVREWLVPAAGPIIASTLRGGCASAVVVVDPLATWQEDLNQGGYTQISGTPWPTFQSGRTTHPCA